MLLFLTKKEMTFKRSFIYIRFPEIEGDTHNVIIMVGPPDFTKSRLIEIVWKNGLDS